MCLFVRVLKEFYFLQASDIFSMFFNISRTELSNPKAPASLERLQSNFDSIFSLYESKIDSKLMSKFSLGFQEDTLTDLLMNIIHISSNDAGVPALQRSASKNYIPLGMKFRFSSLGYQLLDINYEVSYPLSIVLSKKSMTKYQLLFRQLLQFHVISSQLSHCFNFESICGFRSLDIKYPSIKTSMIQMHLLKSKMIFFINSFLSYGQFEVIDYHWNDFVYVFSVERTSDSPLLEFVMNSHSKFLDGCLKDLFLTNWQLYRIISKILSNCMLFITTCNKISKDLGNISCESLENEDEIHARVNSLMAKQYAKIDTNFMFHVHLLIKSLRFCSTTDYDHRIGNLLAFNYFS